MKKSLTDILIENLVGKKIKLYKVLDKRYEPDTREYFLSDKGFLPHPKKCEIIGESVGTIKNIVSNYDSYNKADFIQIEFVDDKGHKILVLDSNTTTSNLEFIN